MAVLDILSDKSIVGDNMFNEFTGSLVFKSAV